MLCLAVISDQLSLVSFSCLNVSKWQQSLKVECNFAKFFVQVSSPKVWPNSSGVWKSMWIAKIPVRVLCTVACWLPEITEQRRKTPNKITNPTWKKMATANSHKLNFTNKPFNCQRWNWPNQENSYILNRPTKSKGVTTQIKALDECFLMVVFTLLLNEFIIFGNFMFNLDRETWQWKGTDVKTSNSSKTRGMADSKKRTTVSSVKHYRPRDLHNKQSCLGFSAFYL